MRILWVSETKQIGRGIAPVMEEVRNDPVTGTFPAVWAIDPDQFAVGLADVNVAQLTVCQNHPQIFVSADSVAAALRFNELSPEDQAKLLLVSKNDPFIQGVKTIGEIINKLVRNIQAYDIPELVRLLEVNFP